MTFLIVGSPFRSDHGRISAPLVSRARVVSPQSSKSITSHQATSDEAAEGKEAVSPTRTAIRSAGNSEPETITKYAIFIN